jgi:hypothetical protein
MKNKDSEIFAADHPAVEAGKVMPRSGPNRGAFALVENLNFNFLG